MEESHIYEAVRSLPYTHKGATLYTKKEYSKTNWRVAKINEDLQQRLGNS